MHAPTRAVELLWQDLRNAPYYIFGDHSKCNQAFCSVRGSEQTEGESDEKVQSDANTEPPIESSTLEDQIDDIIQQEQEDDLSPSLSLEE